MVDTSNRKDFVVNKVVEECFVRAKAEAVAILRRRIEKKRWKQLRISWKERLYMGMQVGKRIVGYQSKIAERIRRD